MTRMKNGLLRFAACALALSLMLALLADIGLMWVQRIRAGSLAHVAAQTALLTIDRSTPPAAQRRHVEDTVRAILAANHQDPTKWNVSLLRSGTSWPPALQAVVSTDQPTTTLLVGLLAGGEARVKAGVTLSAPERPARMIAIRPADEAVLD